VHSKHVKSVEVRDDCQYVITGGDDGSIMVVELNNLDDRRIEKNREQIMKTKEERKKLMVVMNNLFLMKSSDVQSKNDLIKKSEMDVLKA
jgi:tricorn protease-like protein